MERGYLARAIVGCFFSSLLFSSLLLLFLPSIVLAGVNEGAVAYLSWSPTSVVADLAEMPAGPAYLYVRLEGVVDLSGCELELEWVPSGRPWSGCYEFSSGQHPSGSGTSCAWLMRGSQVEGTNAVTDSSWVVAFASDETNSACSSGNVARVLFDFTFCSGDVPGTFCLTYVKLTDSAGRQDTLLVGGGATVLGGDSSLVCEQELRLGAGSGTPDARLSTNYVSLSGPQVGTVSEVAVQLSNGPGATADLRVTKVISDDPLGPVVLASPELPVTIRPGCAVNLVFEMKDERGSKPGKPYTYFRVVTNDPRRKPGVLVLWDDVEEVVKSRGWVPGRLVVKLRQEELGSLEALRNEEIGLRGLESCSALLSSLAVKHGLQAASKLFPDAMPGETSRVSKTGRLVDVPDLSGWLVLSFPEDEDLFKIIADLRELDVVENAELDGRGELHIIPNDDYFDKQWALKNYGAGVYLPGGTEDADIDCDEAWDLTTGASDVVIGFIDTGLDTLHPDIAASLNGESRILPGYFFGDGSADVTDSCGHGTHVCGIGAALTHNDETYGVCRGVAGVCGGWGPDSVGCRILPVKLPTDCVYYDGTMLAEGLKWAADHGADIINHSGGLGSNYEWLREAVDYVFALDIPLVVSMGNGGVSQPVSWPAGWAEYGTCIAVGATDWNDARASYSNMGDHLSVVAPGGSGEANPMEGNILSTTPILVPTEYDPWYDYGAGTSMAAPFVTGIGGLLLSTGTALLDNDVKHLVEASAEWKSEWGERPNAFYGWGRVNARRALDRLSDADTLEHYCAPPTSWVCENCGDPDIFTILNSGDDNLPDGYYWAKRYKVTVQHGFLRSYTTVPEVWTNVKGTRGFEYIGWDGYHWYSYGCANVDTVSLGGCRSTTYVYELWVSNVPAVRELADFNDPEQVGAYKGFWPAPPWQATVSFSVLGSGDFTTSVAENGVTRSKRHLGAIACSPNPIVGGTEIRYYVPAGGPAELRIFTADGRLIRAFEDRGVRAGLREVFWDGKDSLGRVVPSGVYFCRVKQGRETAVRKLVVLK